MAADTTANRQIEVPSVNFVIATNNPLLEVPNSLQEAREGLNIGQTPFQWSNASVMPFNALFIPPSAYCSCITFVKYLLGRQDQKFGNANTIQPLKDYPSVGDIFITSEGEGHIGQVIEVGLDGWFKTDEANYRKCERSSRWLNVNNPKVLGFR